MEGKENIFKAILDRFGDVYQFDKPSNMEVVLDCIPKLVFDDMNRCLLAPVSDVEIRNVVCSMGVLLALGPDGFNGLFYQENWDYIKKEICSAVKSFFNGGDFPRELNETTVTLIPKTPSLNLSTT